MRGSAGSRLAGAGVRALHGDVATGGNRTNALDHVLDDPPRSDRLDDQLGLAGLDHRQVEKLIDELGQVIHLALDLNHEVATGFRDQRPRHPPASRPGA